MLSGKKLVEMARKWQKMASRGRRIADGDAESGCIGGGRAAGIADKGHFVVYAADGKRFMLPLAYLHSPVFQELLNMAEEEFGLSINGAIKFPCDAAVIDYAMSLVRGNVPREVENALMVSLSSSNSRCYSSSGLSRGHLCHHTPLHGF
ncbi:auxin-responsive protein SAUR64-like [Nymphaea colorata]|uniref:Uncharacterized protein n=1 Tax=Nymphaea colorata TaxID=210225 RepID=A0A5K1H2N6_9MAGN|nr:auxin-responsive protein SAUR64-like [Nymphaea colorata]